MNEQSTTDPQTGLDKIFAALRGLGVRRRTDDKWVAGVCSGLADRFGIDPVIVRAALVLLSLVWGVGVTIYLVAWALLPNDKDQIAAERAIRDGDGGSVVLIVIATLALFGGSWWGGGSGWGFPWGLVVAGLIIWWVVQQSRNRPEADQRVVNQQSGAPFAGGPSPAGSGAMPTAFVPSPTGSGAMPTSYAPSPGGSGPAPVPSRPVVPRTPRRRSGGPLMALLAIGLALVTYGSLIWLASEYSWVGSHVAIALAGSLAAIGVLLVVIGFVGWRSGFLSFLAVVLAIIASFSTVLPAGIHFDASAGDPRWEPRSVSENTDYRLGAGDAVLNLTELPTQGLSEAKLPAYVGLGNLTIVVPDDLTVRVVGHVGLGEILLPGESEGNPGQGGVNVNRSTVIGQGPTELVVDAGVGAGQLIVTKE